MSSKEWQGCIVHEPLWCRALAVGCDGILAPTIPHLPPYGTFAIEMPVEDITRRHCAFYDIDYSETGTDLDMQYNLTEHVPVPLPVTKNSLGACEFAFLCTSTFASSRCQLAKLCTTCDAAKLAAISEMFSDRSAPGAYGAEAEKKVDSRGFLFWDQWASLYRPRPLHNSHFTTQPSDGSRKQTLKPSLPS